MSKEEPGPMGCCKRPLLDDDCTWPDCDKWREENLPQPEQSNREAYGCQTCRFRLVVSDNLFHCAADFSGWAFLYSVDPQSVHFRDGCARHVRGEFLFVGHELKSTEFWKIAGERIRPQDWSEWNKDDTSEAVK